MEKLITALRDAAETMGDGLIIAMALGRLPDMFKLLAVHVTQNKVAVTFTLHSSYIQQLNRWTV